MKKLIFIILTCFCLNNCSCEKFEQTNKLDYQFAYIKSKQEIRHLYMFNEEYSITHIID